MNNINNINVLGHTCSINNISSFAYFHTAKNHVNTVHYLDKIVRLNTKYNTLVELAETFKGFNMNTHVLSPGFITKKDLCEFIKYLNTNMLIFIE